MKNISLCVFCGSAPGTNPVYAEAARDLGKLMAGHEIDLVYGGASVGIMTQIADTILEAGGGVYGAIPKQLVDREVAHMGLTRQFITNSMHERKALMANLSDGFAALPGGFGTYEELFEAITWRQLNMHNKPVLLLNTNDYFEPFLAMINHGIREGFINDRYLNLFDVCATPKELVSRFLTEIDQM